VLIEIKALSAAQPGGIRRGEHLVAIVKSRASYGSKSADSCDKQRGSGVNKSFIKPIKFYENSRRIRFECAEKLERGVQAHLLACVMRPRDQRAAKTMR
jgi:hypothetical protein